MGARLSLWVITGGQWAPEASCCKVTLPSLPPEHSPLPEGPRPLPSCFPDHGTPQRPIKPPVTLALGQSNRSWRPAVGCILWRIPPPPGMSLPQSSLDPAHRCGAASLLLTHPVLRLSEQPGAMGEESALPARLRSVPVPCRVLLLCQETSSRQVWEQSD